MNNTNKFRNFLEQSKIYFETILMLILTGTGIIVSIASVKVGIIANNIAENENYQSVDKALLMQGFAIVKAAFLI